MKKILILLLLLASISTLSCGSGGAGPANLPVGENPGIASVIRLLAAQYIAQVNASIYLRAVVLDGNGKPLPSKTVTFSTLDNIGTLSSAAAASRAASSTSFTAVTDSNGIASAKLDYGTAGFITVQAAMDSAASQIIAKNTVYFSTYDLTYPTSSTPLPTLSLSAVIIGNDMQITATVLDGYGAPVSNNKVTFGSDSTSVTFPQGNTMSTDGNGQAIITAKINASTISPFETQVTITASAANGAANMTTLFLSPVAIDTNKSFITATPSIIALKDGTSKINAVVLLNTGAPAPDATTVNFTADCGTVTPFAQTTGGVATATFTAPATPGTCTVKAFVSGTQVGLPVGVTATTALTVQPNAQVVSGLTGGTATFSIFGGAPSYTVASSDIKFPASVSTVSSSGGTFTVTVPANSANSTVTYTVRDTAGTTVTATLTIGTPALSVSPASQTVIDYGIVQFTIAGGAPQYKITSSDTSLNPSPSTVSSSGGVFTVTVPHGNTKAKTVTYTIIDSVGTVVTATLTVTVTPVTPPPVTALAISPAAVTVNAGSSTKFTIIGGTQPYTTTSTDPNNAYDSAPGDGQWSGSSITVTVPASAPAGLVTLNVYDSAGATVSAKLTILGAVGAKMTVNPSTMTLTGLSSGTADNAAFTITGGTAPYTVYSSNTAVVPPPVVSGSAFTINPNPVAVSTNVTITVMDAIGATAAVTVTVTPASASLAINPSAVSMKAGGSVPFNVIGGTGGPLTIVSGNTAIATITNAACTASGTGVLSCPAGTTSFDVTGIAANTTAVTITVIDVNGNFSATAAVTVN